LSSKFLNIRIVEHFHESNCPNFFFIKGKNKGKVMGKDKGKGNGKRNGKDMGEGEDKDLNF
jgi:hypothetical protein